VVSRRKWVKIGIILVWFILFVPQYYWNPFYWNRPQVFIGQYEMMTFEKVNYIYDEDSWIFTLELKSIGNIPVYIREINYTLYKGQTPVKYEAYLDKAGNVLRKDLLRNAVMVPNNETRIIEGDVCTIVGYIYSDADYIKILRQKRIVIFDLIPFTVKYRKNLVKYFDVLKKCSEYWRQKFFCLRTLIDESTNLFLAYKRMHKLPKLNQVGFDGIGLDIGSFKTFNKISASKMSLKSRIDEYLEKYANHELYSA